MEKRAAVAVVVGGSIAGLSCAHSLVAAGWEVVVVERTVSPPSGSPTGAGLSLEPQARGIIDRWLGDPTILHDITLPLNVELHQAFNTEKKHVRTLVQDDHFTYRCAHWTDLHSVIHKALPPGIILWGHRFLSICSSGGASFKIKVQVLQSNEIVEISGDLLIAADGCMSLIRQHFLPNHKLRYSGYSAWRGVFNFSDDEKSNTISVLRKTYPDLGKCLYFDYSSGNHCVLFEIRNQRLNWIWYFNTPEPHKEGNSVTKKVSEEMVKKMHEEASKLWNPALALLMKETEEPFINLIYDSDPLPRQTWENVVLVGDAAHPTTPHASRSTNMSILDAEVLGNSLRKWGPENLSMALQEYQAIRHSVVSKQVMESREMGILKQGLLLRDEATTLSSPEEFIRIQHRGLCFYEQVPTALCG